MNRRTRIATCAVTGALGIVAAFALGISPALAQSYPGGNAGPGDGGGAETAPEVLGTSVEPDGGGLAFTGGNVLLLLALAMLLIAAGVITARLARRRRSLA